MKGGVINCGFSGAMNGNIHFNNKIKGIRVAPVNAGGF